MEDVYNTFDKFNFTIEENSKKLQLLEDNYRKFQELHDRRLQELKNHTVQEYKQISTKKTELEKKYEKNMQLIQELKSKLPALKKSPVIMQGEKRKARLDEVRESNEELKAKRARLIETIKRKKEQRTQSKTITEMYRIREQIELDTYIKATQVELSTVYSKETDQFTLGISFKHVNEHKPNEVYSLTLEYNDDYSVMSISAPIPDLENFVCKLNESRDLHAFIKNLRRGFIESVNPLTQ